MKISEQDSDSDNGSWTYPGFWNDYGFLLVGTSLQLVSIAFAFYYRSYFFTADTDKVDLLMLAFSVFVGFVITQLRGMVVISSKLGLLIRLFNVLVMMPTLGLLGFIIYRLLR